MSKIPADPANDGDPNHVLCDVCNHWRVAHSTFSGCVRGANNEDGDWRICHCIEYKEKVTV